MNAKTLDDTYHSIGPEIKSREVSTDLEFKENGTFILDHGFDTDCGHVSYRLYGTYEVTDKQIILHVTKRLDSSSRQNPNPRKIAYKEIIRFKIKDEDLLEGVVHDNKQVLERE